MNLYNPFSPKPEELAPASPPPAAPQELTPAMSAIREAVVKAIQTCYDPEIPVNIYDLGLVYGVQVNSITEDTAEVVVRMTLTSPSCPAAGSLPGDVQSKTGQVAGVTSARVELVWEPPWHPNNMSEAAKLQLGMF